MILFVCVRTGVHPTVCNGFHRLKQFACISGTACYSTCTQLYTLNIYHCGAERCCEFAVLVMIMSKQLSNKAQMCFQNGTEVLDTGMHTCTRAYTRNTLWVIYIMPGIDYYQMVGESNS